MSPQSSDSAVGLSAAERQAIKDRATELRASRSKKLTGEADLLEKISIMTPDEQVIARRIHALVKEHASHLSPKTWYGMPAWTKEGKVICFFQAASRWSSRYSTLGFDEHAALDSGDSWPTAFAILKLTPDVEKKIVALIKKAS